MTFHTHKYHAKSVVIDGIYFPSQKQAQRYRELKVLEIAKLIENLRLEVSFPLIVNGTKIGAYRADFVYTENGIEKVEDVKGFKTDVYKLKKKLIKAIYNIDIIES